jgi:DNA-binding NarL/FixJ family response regulator
MAAKQLKTSGVSIDQGSPCQVLIIDDQQMFREGLKSCLQNRSTVQVCGELSYPQVELTDYKSTFPRVILAGIPQTQEFGLDFIEALRSRFPDAPGVGRCGESRCPVS